MAIAPVILLTGGSGQLGWQLRGMLPFLDGQEDAQVIAPTHQQLDLTSPAAIREMMQTLRPQWVVNAAAYTAVDKAESDADAAFAINRDAPAVLADEAEKLGIPLIHFSTDYIFDGKKATPYVESDAPNPLSVYGASKLAGERALAESGAAYLNLRTSWVYGVAGKNFLLTILRAAQEREELCIVDDQHGAPTNAFDLAVAATFLIKSLTREAIEKDCRVVDAVMQARGDYHACNSGETTWFGFAEEALRLARAHHPEQRFARLVPITTAEYPTAARRPANSRLNCAKLKKRFGVKWPTWKSSLARVVDALAKESA
ncbi:MAG TPA: dTDP-4-dehydrorhamnose reductase [Acidobacteriaceae bacterium]|jgi:dTDP-4-dehydrorhamnose reductase|nr:dTDP-4-dehydrorhamnose reductase [Acidobacteriaceae bacterium]